MAGGNDNPTTGSGSTAGQPSWAGGPVTTGLQPKDFGGQLLGDIKAVYNQGPKVFNQSLYAGLSDTTRGALSDIAGADTSSFSSGIGGAMDYYSRVARGEMMGQNDPNYDRMRQNVVNDTTANVGQAFSSMGRNFGGSHVGTLTGRIGDTLAGMDYQRLQDDYARRDAATAALPGMLQASFAPAQARLGVGQMLDQDAQAARTAANDLFRRQNDAGVNWTSTFTNLLNGGSGEQGVFTPDPAWWQQLLGFGSGLLGSALGGVRF